MSDNSFIGILSRMKDRLTMEADRREGTWTADNLQAVANELARIYSQEIEDILPQAFIISATGSSLDAACSDYGIARREAVKAEAVLEVTGEPGEYHGVEAYAGDIVFLLDDFLIETAEPVQVRAVAAKAGVAGNVAAGSLTKASDRRIRRVSNPEEAQGGYDRETDEVLRERALEHIRTPAVSGNIAHYIQWAREIPGVVKVRVFDLARGNGTVDVVLIAEDNTPAPEILIEQVAQHIEEVRPIGADVLVESAEAVEVKVSAQVLAQEGYTAPMVQAALMERLTKYCGETAFASSVVSYLGIVSLLFDCPGVADVTHYTINGQDKSLTLLARQFPAAVMPEIIVAAEEVRDA